MTCEKCLTCGFYENHHNAEGMDKVPLDDKPCENFISQDNGEKKDE